MTRHPAALLLLGALFASCGRSETEHAAAGKAKELQQHLAGERFDEIRREFKPNMSNFEEYIRRRDALGRMQHTSLASSKNTKFPTARVLVLSYNSEFDHGHIVETFTFKIEESDGILRLFSYYYHAAKKLECYPVGGCELVDVAPKRASLTH